MNETITLVGEDGQELVLTELMSMTTDEDIGDFTEGSEIILYEDEENNIYPFKVTEEEDSLEVITDEKVIELINDTLAILEDTTYEIV